MAVVAEYPYCHRRQAVKNRTCVGCGQDLIKMKRAQKVRYWIIYRVNGKQRWEHVGLSVEEARAAEGKRKAQKFENPAILEKVPAERMTFMELTEWYLEQKTVKKLASYERVCRGIKNFNNVLGDHVVGSLKPLDLENYQEKREGEGLAAATIDMELSLVKTMVIKAFDNDLVDGRTVKAFRRVKRKLRRGANVRRRTLSIAEYRDLLNAAAPHLEGILVVAFNTGMRTGELRALKWKHLDQEKGVINLPAEITKENRDKIIPVNHHVDKVLASQPKALHHDFVFTYKGAPVTPPGGLRNSFVTACGKAGIPYGQGEPNGVTFHDIRRTVKTNMLNAGVDKVHRDLILGHSLQGMDAHYLAPSIEDLHREMEKYTTWLDDKIASVSKNVSNEVKKA